MTKAAKIREFQQFNTGATPQEIAAACGVKLQYVHTVLHKAKIKLSTEEKQLAKGNLLLNDEINSLRRQITRLTLHNDMLQSMLKVQEFDLIHRHGSTV
jgi:hypothetical protein